MTGPLLQLKEVTAGYDTKIVLRNVTLDVDTKDFIIICGPNGGGKSTLLRTIAGLLKPKAGECLQEKDIVMGYLPQYRGIDRAFPITVEETILSGLNCRKKAWESFKEEDYRRVEELLEKFQLTELAKRPIDALSGGQWQRTLLARSLAGEPDIWTLDEPDTHLDVEGKKYLHQLLTNEIGKRAIILVTHNPEDLSYFHHSKIWRVHDQSVQTEK